MGRGGEENTHASAEGKHNRLGGGVATSSQQTRQAQRRFPFFPCHGMAQNAAQSTVREEVEDQTDPCLRVLDPVQQLGLWQRRRAQKTTESSPLERQQSIVSSQQSAFSIQAALISPGQQLQGSQPQQGRKASKGP